jgi:hypothetical protein
MRAVFPSILALMVALGGRRSLERTSQPELPSLRQGAPQTEGDLRYTAETAILESFPVQLATTVRVSNVGSRPAALEFSDGCPVLLRAYRTAARTYPPVWDQERDTFCTQALQLFTLEPGNTKEFTVRTDARQILGDSLPNGDYFLTAVVRKTGWPLELDAGQVELAR